MQLRCGRLAAWNLQRKIARQKRLEEWHEWFAWRPVKVGDQDCRWLERVWRRRVYQDYEGLPGYPKIYCCTEHGAREYMRAS